MIGNPRNLPDGILPWTKSCLVCGEHNPRGFRLKSRLEGGRVILDYTTRPHDTGYKDLVHGGIVMTLLDEIMTWAAILETGRVCVAAEMTTRLQEPVRAGQHLRMEAWIEKNARRLILTAGRAIDVATGVVVNESSGKYLPVASDRAALHADDFVHDPSTIPAARILRAAE